MAKSRNQKGYDTRIITEKLNEFPVSRLDTIQSQTQHQYNVELDEEDLIEGHRIMVEDRSAEVHLIEQEVTVVYEMYKDMARLVNEQQPVINNIVHTIEAKGAVNVEVGTKELEEAYARKGWCVIL